MKNNKIATKFESVLNSKKFKDDLIENHELLKDLYTFYELREHFIWFLLAYPLSDKKKFVIRKLNGKKKFGLLSRHLASVSSKLGISQIFLKNFYKLKDDERHSLRRLKNEDWKYAYNLFNDEDRILKLSDTIKQQISIAEDKANIETKCLTLSRMLLEQTIDLIEFCLDKYNSREDKINQILGDR